MQDYWLKCNKLTKQQDHSQERFVVAVANVNSSLISWLIQVIQTEWIVLVVVEVAFVEVEFVVEVFVVVVVFVVEVFVVEVFGVEVALVVEVVVFVVGLVFVVEVGLVFVVEAP